MTGAAPPCGVCTTLSVCEIAGCQAYLVHGPVRGDQRPAEDAFVFARPDEPFELTEDMIVSDNATPTAVTVTSPIIGASELRIKRVVNGWFVTVVRNGEESGPLAVAVDIPGLTRIIEHWSQP